MGDACEFLDGDDGTGPTPLYLGGQYFAATISLEAWIPAKGRIAPSNFAEDLDLLLGGKADDHVLAGAVMVRSYKKSD